MVKSLFNTAVFYDPKVANLVADFYETIDTATERDDKKFLDTLLKEHEAIRQEVIKKIQETANSDYDKNWKKRAQTLLKKMDVEMAVAKSNDANRRKESPVLKNTAQQVAETKKNVNKTVAATKTFKDKNVEHKDQWYSLEFDKDGTLSKKTLVSLLSDLDGRSGVEGKNVAWIRRAFGATEQKYNIGERQLMHELKGLSKEQLTALYQRITGDNFNLAKINNKDESIFATEYRGKDSDERADKSKLNVDMIGKFENFRNKMVEQASVVADVSSVLLGDAEARTGLRSVVKGRVNQLYTALADPAQAEKYVKTLAERGVVSGEKNIFEKVGGVLLQLGLNIGARIASLGTVGVYVQNNKIDHKKLTNAFSLANMSAMKPIGENGASVGVDLDLLGGRIEASWNNPEARMKVAYNEFVAQTDKVAASKKLVDTWNSKLDSKNQHAAKIMEIGKKFIEHQTQVFNEYNKLSAKTPKNNVAFNEVMNKNALDYLAQVEKVQGTRLKGIFANANLAGFGLGLNAARVNVTSTAEGVKFGAGTIEAEILGPEKLTEEGVNEILKDMNIERKGDVYYQDGKEVVKVAPGNKLQWNFETINTPNGIQYRIKGYKEVPQNAKTFTLKKLDNVDIKNNSQQFSDLALKLGRVHKRDYPRMTNAIHSGNYQEAMNILENNILRQHRNKSDKKSVEMALNAIQKVKNNPAKTEEFMKQFLEKTSGGTFSRQLADKLLSGDKNAVTEVRKYYDRSVATAFGKLFGISKTEVMGTLDTILRENNNSPKVTTLSNEGFGAVAYAQGSRNHRALGYINHQTQVIGAPIEVANDSVLKKVQPKLEQILLKQNPSISPSDAKDIVQSGKLKAALSFVENSECFNLIFFVETQGGASVENKGTVIGKTQVSNLEGGLYGGGSWKREKVETDNKTTNPGKGQEKLPDARTDATAGEIIKWNPDAVINTGKEAIGKVAEDATKQVAETLEDVF